MFHAKTLVLFYYICKYTIQFVPFLKSGGSRVLHEFMHKIPYAYKGMRVHANKEISVAVMNKNYIHVVQV